MDATIFLDIVEPDSFQWSATPRVPLTQLDGQWYLARAPIAPD
jgi:hypothetical protein